MEGRILARRLAEEGIAVTAFVDAAAFSVFPMADMVLIGSDALVPVGLINKVGRAGWPCWRRGPGCPCTAWRAG